jgi:hypothetical protein
MEAIPRKFSPEELVALTAAERRRLGSEFDARKAVAEIQLRQWCVEQAVAVFGELPVIDGHTVSETAKDILDFVSAPLKPEVPNG